MNRSQLKQLGLATGATEPVDVADVKAWSAIDTDLDDAVITAIIVSAREMCENFISKDVVAKNYTYFQPEPCLEDDGFYYIYLPRPTEANLITSVQDANGDLIEGEGWEMYGVDGRVIRLLNGYQDYIQVGFESLPVVSSNHQELIKSAIKSLVEQIYDNRANLEGDSDIMVLDRNVRRILTPAKYIYF